MNTYYVYILSNESNTAIYVGVTNNLERRIAEHKSGMTDGFTKKYNIHKLVYAEECNNAYDAIAREKQIKKWRREKKEMLVNDANPEWKDMASEFL